MSRNVLILCVVILAVVEFGALLRVTKEPATQCGTNEEVSLCGRMCEPTCSDKTPNRNICPAIACSKFTSGCRCVNGTYRNEQNQCVYPQDCPQDE